MADLTGKLVLVVEDEPMIGYAIEDFLLAAGAGVIGPVCSVAQALDTLAATAPDCATLDWNLSRELSIPVAEQLLRRGIPFIFLTGSPIAEVTARYPGIPALPKPYDLAVLPAALARLFPQLDAALGELLPQEADIAPDPLVEGVE